MGGGGGAKEVTGSFGIWTQRSLERVLQSSMDYTVAKCRISVFKTFEKS